MKRVKSYVMKSQIKVLHRQIILLVFSRFSLRFSVLSVFRDSSFQCVESGARDGGRQQQISWARTQTWVSAALTLCCTCHVFSLRTELKKTFTAAGKSRVRLDKTQRDQTRQVVYLSLKGNYSVQSQQYTKIINQFYLMCFTYTKDKMKTLKAVNEKPEMVLSKTIINNIVI